MSDTAEVLYKCDAFYHKQSEGGISFNDPALNIDWQIPADKAIVAEKDLGLSGIENHTNNFIFEL